MKKTVLISSGILAIAFVIIAAFSVNLNSSPLQTKDNIPVDEFSSVSIAISSTVYIEQGNSCKLEIDAPESVLEKIDVKVQSGKLVIKPVDNKNDANGNVTIRIAAPDFESIILSGSVKLFAQGEMNLDELELILSGSGSMDFDRLSADEIELKISGSGKMELSGRGAKELLISIAGSGDLDARDFQVEELGAKISGSADCKVFVTKELEAAIAGSGTVYYKGTPQVETSIAGSGAVKKLKE